MTDKHATTLRSDGGKPPLSQAQCSCGWETGYMSELSAKSKAKKHREENRNG